MEDWSPPVAPAAPPATPASRSFAPFAPVRDGVRDGVAARYVSDAEWEYRLRTLRRKDRFDKFERAEDTHSKRLWCLMLTLMILCGAAVLVAVLVAAAIFTSQN